RFSRDWSSDVCSSDLICAGTCLKAELERQLQADQQRIRNIEARLQSVRDAEAHRSLDVVVKHVPAQMAVTTRAQVPSFDDALRRSEERRVGKEWRARG